VDQTPCWGSIPDASPNSIKFEFVEVSLQGDYCQMTYYDSNDCSGESKGCFGLGRSPTPATLEYNGHYFKCGEPSRKMSEFTDNTYSEAKFAVHKGTCWNKDPAPVPTSQCEQMTTLEECLALPENADCKNAWPAVDQERATCLKGQFCGSTSSATTPLACSVMGLLALLLPC
jgi:hypothetical protein